MVDSHVADVGGLQTPLDIHRDGEGLLVMPTDGDGVVLQTIRSGYTNPTQMPAFCKHFSGGANH